MPQPQQLQAFIEFIETINRSSGVLLPDHWRSLPDVEIVRRFLSGINRYFFQTRSDLGRLHCLDEEFQYFSEFHRFWESHHKEIIGAEVDRGQAGAAATALSEAVRRYGADILRVRLDTLNLAPTAVAQVRFLTANQDFREPPTGQFRLYLEDPAQYNARVIADDPAGFLRFLGLTRLSQTDKRLDYAKNAARLLLDLGCDAYGLAAVHCQDAASLRNALVASPNTGYGLKKANMFIRDMVELGVWPDLANFDAIDVASDINTMKLALRTRILRTSMPLVSSLLDVFCYQYGHIDEASAGAWRAVWEEWRALDGLAPRSPSQMDYLLYSIGRSYCRDILVRYRCERGHGFHHFGAQLRLCRECAGQSVRSTATPTARLFPCQVPSGELPREGGELMLPHDNPLRRFGGTCVLESVCNPTGPDFCALDPPKSISIKGQTGWLSAYADECRGGGGLMA